ncbi:MAG: hypothetical protein OT477_12915 [Chloroflexi bacterium]|nr:hypothetical protein [Chloroflexota bacterium]
MWHLELGGEQIAQLQPDGIDWPWTYAKLLPSPRFEPFRTYFGEVDDWPETAEFNALYHHIHAQGGFVFHDTTSGNRYHSFTLHHDGDIVWFRTS